MDDNRALTMVLAILGGLIAGLVLVLAIILIGSGDDDPSAGSTTTTATTTPASTTPPSTTTVASTTTTTLPPTTTTAPDLGWDTATKSSDAVIGDPGPSLIDVRVGDHPGFVRIVFDFTGVGTPAYAVGYEAGPSFTGSGGGDPVSPAGSAFLAVHVFPGLTYDIDTLDPAYYGPLSFDPGFDPVAEVAFVDDFEADMFWIIGLDEMTGFTVDTLVDPVRLVVDIAD